MKRDGQSGQSFCCASVAVGPRPLARVRSERAVCRCFLQLSNDRFGSKASDRRARRVRGMSAVPPIAPRIVALQRFDEEGHLARRPAILARLGMALGTRAAARGVGAGWFFCGGWGAAQGERSAGETGRPRAGARNPNVERTAGVAVVFFWVGGPVPRAMALRAALTASMTWQLLGSGVKVKRSATAERNARASSEGPRRPRRAAAQAAQMKVLEPWKSAAFCCEMHEKSGR
jgi:hypothetical protein